MKTPITPMHDREGFIWHNGSFVPWGEAKIHVLTHSLHYGMAVFEGIRAYPTAQGVAVFRLREHIDRLFESAHILEMAIPYTRDYVIEAVAESVVKNNIDSAYIRPLVFYGSESMGLRATDLSVQVIIAAWDWGKYIDEGKQQGGMRVKTSSFTRHHVNVAMCRAKCSGHYVNSTLALHEVMRSGYDEALLLDVNGFVAEGTGENIFMYKQGKLFTPALLSCLNGVTRQTIISIAQDMGIEVVEKAITRDELYVADEAFFTGTAAEIATISSIDDRTIGNGCQGEITRTLSDAYFALVHGHNQRRLGWLHLCS